MVFLGANTLSIGANNLSTTFSGAIHGTGGVAKIGAGTLTLSGSSDYTGPTTVNVGTLLVNGSVTSTVMVNGGTLGGSGTTRGVTVNDGGTLSPGNSAGILSVAGDLTLMMGATYLVDLNGATVGTQYDQTNVVGLVKLYSATLSLSLGFMPMAGTMFTIINNDLSDGIAGTFDGLAEGTTFTAAGEAFSITYHGGDGNDVVLTSVVPEPTTWILVTLGAAVLIVTRKQRRSRA